MTQNLCRNSVNLHLGITLSQQSQMLSFVKISVLNLTETQPETRIFFKNKNRNPTQTSAIKTQTQPKPEIF